MALLSMGWHPPSARQVCWHEAAKPALMSLASHLRCIYECQMLCGVLEQHAPLLHGFPYPSSETHVLPAVMRKVSM